MNYKDKCLETWKYSTEECVDDYRQGNNGVENECGMPSLIYVVRVRQGNKSLDSCGV